jgi:nicotinamidase-related amidase
MSPTAVHPPGFGGRIGFGRSPLLLVVDLTRAFTDPRRPLGANLDGVVAATNALLAAARGVPTLFASVRYEARDLVDAGVWAAKMRGLSDLGPESDGSELDPRLALPPDAQRLARGRASCFFATGLADRLTAAGVDTLLLAGCTTSGCVRATAVDASQHGFRTIVVAEACGDRDPAAHAQSLVDLDSRYADVVSLETATRWLAERR